MSGFDTAAYMRERRARVEEGLDHRLPPSEAPPQEVHEAMRYSLFAGGKRLRPILALATAEALGQDGEAVSDLACALEMIHTFSLIHDDLPAMDDDDFRRGKPTLHKRYGEAVAILAGDALLALALETLATPSGDPAADGARLRVIRIICKATGTPSGMIAGQVADVTSEGRPFDAEKLRFIHVRKTGALIRASVEGAAILAQAEPDQLVALTRYAERIGLAFQIVDDVLDVVGVAEELGKSAGKDDRACKATYPALHGVEASKEKARSLIAQAVCELDFLGSRGAALKGIAEFLAARRF